jgi:predicted glycosyl hydrolase (DUF1957 family)
MDATAFSEMLGVVDDAIRLADDAVKAADAASARKPQETVTLVKVAQARYYAVADALIKTGSFREYTREGLAKTLESAGTAGYLELMEKLASRAVFPLESAEVDLGGDLVEKSAATRAQGLTPGSQTAIWRQALDEAEAECGG